MRVQSAADDKTLTVVPSSLPRESRLLDYQA